MMLNELGLIYGLLDTIHNCPTLVLESIQATLTNLGYEHPNLVLKSIYTYSQNTDMIFKNDAQVCLYSTVEDIVNNKADSLDEMEIIELWVTKSADLLATASTYDRLQRAATLLLVTLCRKLVHHDFIMKELLNTLKPDTNPPMEIVNTFSLILLNSKDVSIYFKDILSKIAPNMCIVKNENLRGSIINLLKKIAQGLLEVTASSTTDDQLNLVEHQENFGIAYEQLLYSWFKTSSLVMKSSIIEAFGYISSHLSLENLNVYCTPSIHAILGAYKRSPSPFLLSYSLAIFCESVVNKGIEETLKQHLESVLATLISQACSTLDYNDIVTVKNYSEVLRCYEILAKSFPETVISQVLQRLENASHVQRSGALGILKHLINCQRVPEEFHRRMFTNLNIILSDLNSKVIKNMSQLILSLGSKGIMSQETARPFVDYLVRHAAGGRLEPKGRIDLAEVCNEPAKDVCCESVILLGTIPSAVPILWPRMLQYLMNPEYEESLPVTLKCLANLTSLKETNYSTGVPSVFEQTPPILREAVVVKLLMLCSVPNKSTIGIDCLELLKGLAGHISPDLVLSWSEHLPALKTQYTALSSNYSEPMVLEKFQSSLKHFLESTVITFINDCFIENLIASLKSDLERYDKHQPYRCFLMSLIGVGLKYLTDIDLTRSTLEFLYNTVNHKSSADQESFSSAVGMCASTKTGLVFSKIEEWLKAIDSLKRSILSLLEAQDSRLEEQTFLKVSIVHCLGQIAILSMNERVQETVGGPVMLHLLNIINSSKVEMVNDTIMLTVSKISRSLVKVPKMSLRQRPILITHIVNTMMQADLSPISLTNCLQALRDIVALQPELDVAERTLVLKTSIASCFSKLNVNTSGELDSNLVNCYSILNVLIRTIVQHDPQLATLDDIITLLRPTVDSQSEVLRWKSLDLIHSSFCTYRQNVVILPDSSFTKKPQFLAIIVPRINDSIMDVKMQGLACFKLIMKIDDMYCGESSQTNNLANEALETLQTRIITTDEDAICSNLELIGDIICSKLNLEGIASFIRQVDIGLQDQDRAAACGVAQILSAVFNTRGSQMQGFFPKPIIAPIYKRLKKVTDPHTRFYAIEALCHYAQHKVTRFSNILATFPIPFEDAICETFQRMGGSNEMCVNLLTHFTQILERTPPYAMQNTADGDRVKIANLLPLSVICAMKEMFRFKDIRKEDDERGILLQLAVSNEDVENTTKEINDTFASLFPLLILWYGSYIDCLPPLHQASPLEPSTSTGFIPNREATKTVPAKCVLECIRCYLRASGYCNELDVTISILINVSELETFDNFISAIGDIIQDFVKYAPDRLSSFVAYLDAHHSYEVQRITVACVFGTLVSVSCNSDFALLEIVLTSLINRIHDESVQVQRLAIGGLSALNQKTLPENFEKSAEVLCTLVAATEIKNKANLNLDTEVIVEALAAISIAIINMKFEIIQPHVKILFNKVCIFLEKPAALRDAVTSLLLSLVISIEPTSEYRKIIYTHLLGAFLHLLDPFPPVAVSCTRILSNLDKHLQNENLCARLKENLVVQKNFNYLPFMADIAPHLIEELDGYAPIFVREAIDYYKHKSGAMRKAAVILTAHMVNVGEDYLDLPLITKAALGLHPLMKDSNLEVAVSAIRSISLYKKYSMVL